MSSRTNRNLFLKKEECYAALMLSHVLREQHPDLGEVGVNDLSLQLLVVDFCFMIGMIQMVATIVTVLFHKR